MSFVLAAVRSAKDLVCVDATQKILDKESKFFDAKKSSLSI